ncbi:hypothetical protein PtB15_4B359 [Puccinia triticina]|nr:hypothetical protein PtB15_4B359 [Puccinia triticina]
MEASGGRARVRLLSSSWLRWWCCDGPEDWFRQWMVVTSWLVVTAASSHPGTQQREAHDHIHGSSSSSAPIQLINSNKAKRATEHVGLV